MRVINKFKLDTSSVNREAGTFRVRSTTPYPNLTKLTNANGSSTDYYEVLSHKPENVDLSKVAAGSVPFLLNHRDIKMGDVSEVELVDGEATYSTVKVLDAYKDRVFDLIESGALTHVSVGGQATTVVSRSYKDSIPMLERKWSFSDLSFTPTPADPSCHIVRSDSQEDIAIETVSQFDEAEIEIARSQLDNNDTNHVEYKKEDAEVQKVDETEVKTEVAETVEPQTPPAEFVAPASKVADTDALPENVTRSTSTSNTQVQKENFMSLFKFIDAAKKGTLSEEDQKMIAMSDSGSFMVSDTLISRALNFAAGTGTNTTGLTDQGGPLIPKDMSSDVIGNIYARLVLRKSGVRFVPLMRPVLFPVIKETGAAQWIDENGNATDQTIRTTNRAVKPHYIRLVYDISVPAIKEAAENISVMSYFADDWVNKIGQLIEKAFFKGDPAVTAGSPTGIVTLLESDPAYADNILTYAGDQPTYTEWNSYMAYLEDKQAGDLTVFTSSALKYALVSSPIVAGNPTFMARDTGSGVADVLGKTLYSVPTSVLAADEIVIGSTSGAMVATFHGSMEVIEDEKILAGNNQVRYTIRTAVDVFFRYPQHWLFINRA